jgi:hypothetical protein
MSASAPVADMASEIEAWKERMRGELPLESVWPEHLKRALANAKEKIPGASKAAFLTKGDETFTPVKNPYATLETLAKAGGVRVEDAIAKVINSDAYQQAEGWYSPEEQLTATLNAVVDLAGMKAETRGDDRRHR